MEEIKASDTVRVKSGGPVMTVSWVGDEYGVMTALCSWFAGNTQQSDKFPVAVLVHAEPPSGGAASIRTVRS